MPKTDNISVKGIVLTNNRNNFTVELENGHVLKATLSGKMGKFRIRVSPQDEVLVSISPYSMERGIITQRVDNRQSNFVQGENQRRKKSQKQAVAKSGKGKKSKK